MFPLRKVFSHLRLSSAAYRKYNLIAFRSGHRDRCIRSCKKQEDCIPVIRKLYDKPRNIPAVSTRGTHAGIVWVTLPVSTP